MTSVLIVEDNTQLARLFQSILIDITDGVWQAKTAALAFQKLQSEAFDVVILDTELPDADGSIIVEYLRRDPRHSKTYIIVATDNQQLGLEAKSAGADRILEKPVSIMELRHVVRRVTLSV